MSATWTKHDYEFFAEVLHQTPMSSGDRDFLEQDFARVFNKDNYNFDRERWSAAVFEGQLTHRGGTAKYGHWSAKTYRMTAEILSRLSNEETKIALISAFGAAFERDNPRFDWARFRKAAGSPYAVEDDSGYLTPGDDPSMPGGGPPVYHGPEERYGGRRVRVHPHFRSRPGGRKRAKYVHVRGHYRDV
jgi:hypothetical protein